MLINDSTKTQKPLTQARLKEFLKYDESTGRFIWIKKISPKIKIGEFAGFTNKNGYEEIIIDRVLRHSHRLVWLYFHDEYPEKNCIRHINKIRNDNKISNLLFFSKKPELLSVNRLKDLLIYDENTGVFTVKVSYGRRDQGNVAGRVNKNGYIDISIDGKKYLAHRLAWLYVFDAWPKQQIDHIDGNRKNNKLNNLRQASNSENCQNRKSFNKANKSTGLLGASFDKRSNKYASYIKINGKKINLGKFETIEEAHNRYIAAKRKYHKFCTI